MVPAGLACPLSLDAMRWCKKRVNAVTYLLLIISIGIVGDIEIFGRKRVNKIMEALVVILLIALLVTFAGVGFAIALTSRDEKRDE